MNGTREPEPPEETPLIDEVRQALAGHPLDLLGMVSILVEATKPDPLAWLPSRPRRETADLAPLLDGFIGVQISETTALLAVLAELLDDPDLRDRCRKEVTARRDVPPSWVTDLARVEVHQVVRMTHVLGDGDEILIGAKLASGDELTCIASVDHHARSVVKDGFFVPDSIDNVVGLAAERNVDPDTSFVAMSPADARAWLEHGLRVHAVLVEQSDTWPGCRPLMQWLIGHLPSGGVEYHAPEWDPASLRQLFDDFFASAQGAAFNQGEHGQLLEELLAIGDPLRWSVMRVEHVLEAARDGGVTVPLDVTLHAPELLSGFVPFAHARSGIRDELTAEALAAIDGLTPAYREAVRRGAADQESRD